MDINQFVKDVEWAVTLIEIDSLVECEVVDEGIATLKHLIKSYKEAQNNSTLRQIVKQIVELEVQFALIYNNYRDYDESKFEHKQDCLDHFTNKIQDLYKLL